LRAALEELAEAAPAWHTSRSSRAGPPQARSARRSRRCRPSTRSPRRAASSTGSAPHGRGHASPPSTPGHRRPAPASPGAGPRRDDPEHRRQERVPGLVELCDPALAGLQPRYHEPPGPHRRDQRGHQPDPHRLPHPRLHRRAPPLLAPGTRGDACSHSRHPSGDGNLVAGPWRAMAPILTVSPATRDSGVSRHGRA
jgi:hypothetical protein